MSSAQPLPVRGQQAGDRAAFLTRFRPPNGPRTSVGAEGVDRPVVPSLRWRALDTEANLADVFEAAAYAAGSVVHRNSADEAEHGRAEVAAAVIGQVRALLSAHGGHLQDEDGPPDHPLTAVCPEVPELRPWIEAFGAAGVVFVPYSVEAARTADIGLTAANCAVAVTGTVVIDADERSPRGCDLLASINVCIVEVTTIVASPEAVLRSPGTLPSQRVLVSGPSRTGDIEQILTVGVHGPVAVHVILDG